MAVSSALFLSPASAGASVLSFLSEIFSGSQAKAEQNESANSQNMALLQAVVSPNPDFARGGGDITVTGDSALLPDSGPEGTQADISDESASNGQISIYVVREGDTLSQIAKMFGVSVNTILWANSLKGSSVSPGQKLVILPVSGTQHTIVKGDTIKSIAKKYKADVGEILTFNGLSEDSQLAIGDTIIIPDGDAGIVAPSSGKSAPTSKSRGTRNVPDYSGYYLRPVSYDEGRKTQGLHGYNGIDIGATQGTPVRAAADGTVLVARFSGWNGGYGKYVVLQHKNGTQTLYGHLSSVGVNEGSDVAQGQIIGLVGNTGRSTGSHLHFEVRGAKNPY